MLSSLSSFFSDGHALPILATVIAILVIAGLAFWVYRLAFANRLRPPGAARGRAPRLGVVDVFGLDGQRQLVIVRRDNVEHLLLLGGPNDIVIEPNISRGAANGREGKPAAAPEPAPEQPALPAPIPRPTATVRREPAARPVETPAPVEPVVVLTETRARPAPIPRTEPSKPEAAKPAPVAEAPKPVVVEAVKPLETAFDPIGEPAGDAGKPEAPRRPIATPRATPAGARPGLPPPITPLRARPDPVGEPIKPVEPKPAAEIVTLKPAEAPLASTKPVEVKPVVEAPPVVAKPKKDDTFYDLESLEAEMARLLGRDP